MACSQRTGQSSAVFLAKRFTIQFVFNRLKMIIVYNNLLGCSDKQTTYFTCLLTASTAIYKTSLRFLYIALGLEAESWPWTNTCAGTITDKNSLQQAGHFAGLSPRLAILWFVCTGNPQWLWVLRCAHAVIFARLLLHSFGNTWHEYDHYQWVILQ